MEVKKIISLLKKYKELGYIVVIEYNIWVVKEEKTGKTIAEIYSNNASDRKQQLENFYNDVLSKQLENSSS